MTQPAQQRIGVVKLEPVGDHRPLDHDHGQAQSACRDQFGLGTGATRVFANDDIDRMALQQAKVALDGKWSAIDDKVVMRQGGGALGRIDEAQQVAVLRLRGEGLDVHASERQHDAALRPRQGFNGAAYVGDRDPVVIQGRLPGRAAERGHGHAGLPGGLDGVAAHRCGKRMGRIDQVGDAMIAQIGGEAGNAAEAADAHAHGLGARLVGAPGIAERRRDPCVGQASGQGAGFGSTAQEKDVRHG